MTIISDLIIKPLISMNFEFINIEKNKIVIYYIIILFFKLNLFTLSNNY